MLGLGIEPINGTQVVKEWDIEAGDYIDKEVPRFWATDTLQYKLEEFCPEVAEDVRGYAGTLYTYIFERNDGMYMPEGRIPEPTLPELVAELKEIELEAE